MKLPPIQQGPVQSLGRLSPSLPISAANARANALLEIGIAADKWGEANDQADADLAASRAAIDEGKLRQRLLQQNVYEKPDGTVVPMHEVMDSVYDEGVGKIRETYAEDLSKKARVQFETKFNGRLATGAQEIAKGSFDKGYQALKATTAAAWEGYVIQGDELSAMQTIANALESGVYTIEEYQERTLETGIRIDTQRVVDQMMAIGSDEDVERIRHELVRNNMDGRPSRIPLEQRMQLQQQLAVREKEFDTERTRRQEENTGKLFSAYMGSQLNKADIDNALRNEDISYQQAAALESKLNQPPAPMMTSNPGRVGSINTAILNLRSIPAGNATMTETLVQIEDDIDASVNGMRADGTLVPQTLSPEDGLKLKQAARQEYDRAFTDKRYTNAMDIVKKTTGMNSMIDMSKNSDNNRSYLAFKAELEGKLDSEGSSYDLVGWAQDNAKRFDPSFYKTDNPQNTATKRLAELYKVPPSILGAPRPGEAIAGGRAAYPNYNPDRVRAWAGRRNMTGEMSDSEFEQIMSEVGSGSMSADDYMKFEAIQQ